MVVLSFHHRDRFYILHWLCKCDCGNEKIISGCSLKSNLTRSCGCLHSESSKKNAEKINIHTRKYERKCATWLAYIQSKYDLSPKDWTRMVLESNGKCRICQNDFRRESQDCVIDHDHLTERVRGLLCNRCNIVLYYFDNKEIYNRILDYLETPITVTE